MFLSPKSYLYEPGFLGFVVTGGFAHLWYGGEMVFGVTERSRSDGTQLVS